MTPVGTKSAPAPLRWAAAFGRAMLQSVGWISDGSVRQARRVHSRLSRAVGHRLHLSERLVRRLTQIGIRRGQAARRRAGKRLIAPIRRRVRKGSTRLSRTVTRPAARHTVKVLRRTHKRTVRPTMRWTGKWVVRPARRRAQRAARRLNKAVIKAYRRSTRPVTSAFRTFVRRVERPIQHIRHRYHDEVRGIQLKESGRSFDRSFKGPWGKLRYQLAGWRGLRKKQRVWRQYRTLAQPVSFDVPYIYVALHFQPERTTSSLGGVYANQTLMVDLLARLIPEGWWLYVKEHPSQFYPAFCGERARHRGFYESLTPLPNIKLVTLSTSPFDLIDHSQAVATVTGTTGWESVVRGKPVLIFGHGAWYRGCEGVSYVPDEEGCRDALARVAAGYRPDMRKVLLFMRALDEVCIRADMGYNNDDERALNLSYEESVDRLTYALERAWYRAPRQERFATAAPRERIG